VSNLRQLGNVALLKATAEEFGRICLANPSGLRSARSDFLSRFGHALYDRQEFTWAIAFIEAADRAYKNLPIEPQDQSLVLPLARRRSAVVRHMLSSPKEMEQLADILIESRKLSEIAGDLDGAMANVTCQMALATRAGSNQRVMKLFEKHEPSLRFAPPQTRVNAYILVTLARQRRYKTLHTDDHERLQLATTLMVRHRLRPMPVCVDGEVVPIAPSTIAAFRGTGAILLPAEEKFGNAWLRKTLGIIGRALN
jgi:hypothetical protein